MNKEFSVHRLNEAGMANAMAIGNVFDSLLIQLSNMCQPSREFSLCKTKLEEACFFAKKAMASDPANGEAQ